MKVPLHIVHSRRHKLAALLHQQSYLPIQEVCRRLGVSEATARRDLQALALQKKLVRTFGGAVTDFNQRFTSFRDRQAESAEAKQQIAARARRLIEPGMTVFFDAGTTVAAVAQEIRQHPVGALRVVTNSLPVAETLAETEGVSVHLLGGEFLKRQSVLVGPAAVKALAFYEINLAILGAEAADVHGIWNSQEEVVHQQKIALSRAEHHVFCLHRSKLGRTAPAFLTAWSAVEAIITDLPWTEVKETLPLLESQYLSL